MQEADVAANRAIGAAGAAAIREAAGRAGGLRVLTHCNTGSLATVQYGTALGCLRALHAAGDLARAYCTETRCACGQRLDVVASFRGRTPREVVTLSGHAALRPGASGLCA